MATIAQQQQGHATTPAPPPPFSTNPMAFLVGLASPDASVVRVCLQTLLGRLADLTDEQCQVVVQRLLSISHPALGASVVDALVTILPTLSSIDADALVAIVTRVDAGHLSPLVLTAALSSPAGPDASPAITRRALCIAMRLADLHLLSVAVVCCPLVNLLFDLDAVIALVERRLHDDPVMAVSVMHELVIRVPDVAARLHPMAFALAARNQHRPMLIVQVGALLAEVADRVPRHLIALFLGQCTELASSTALSVNARVHLYEEAIRITTRLRDDAAAVHHATAIAKQVAGDPVLLHRLRRPLLRLIDDALDGHCP
ncbi:Uncharacterized protein PBTT_09153 [Plasmodiophora brassicae]